MTATITLRNAITGERQDIEADPELTVHQVVERSGFIVPSSDFSVRDKDGQVVDQCPVADFANTLLTVGLPADSARGGGHQIIEEIAAGFLALKLLGPFAEAFASKLGERLGESAAAAVSRVRLFGRGGGSQKELVVEDATTNTVVVIPEQLTDDARLALIDLDLTRDGVRGEILHWSPGSKTWRPIGVGASTITLRNAVTDTQQVIEADPALTVRQVVERSGFIAPGNKFRVRAGQTIVDEFPSVLLVDTVVTVGLPSPG